MNTHNQSQFASHSLHTQISVVNVYKAALAAMLAALVVFNVTLSIAFAGAQFNAAGSSVHMVASIPGTGPHIPGTGPHTSNS